MVYLVNKNEAAIFQLHSQSVLNNHVGATGLHAELVLRGASRVPAAPAAVFKNRKKEIGLVFLTSRKPSGVNYLFNEEQTHTHTQLLTGVNTWCDCCSREPVLRL